MTKLEELLKILDELIQLLEDDGEQQWSQWMRQSREWLLNSDYSGIEKLLSAYGGMSSFNDLIICQSYEDGNWLYKDDFVEKNEQLSQLRSRAWKLANSIRRSHFISDS